MYEEKFEIDEESLDFQNFLNIFVSGISKEF